MKNRKLWAKPYRKLISKIFIRIILLALLAFAVVVVIRSAGRGKFGNAITTFIMEFFDIDWYSAQNAYFDYIRVYLDYIIIGAIFIFFLLFLRLLLSWFTKYFDEIIEGVNELAAGDKRQITMSPEMAFMSDKLNKVNDELIRSAQAERDAEKRKNDLIVYLAHDIKTPLTSVIGYLSLLDETPDMPPEQKEKYTHIALVKAFRLESLINEFFEITRYNLEAIPLNRENIDLCYMMVQIADEAYPQLAESGKTVSILIPEDLTLYADSEKMARVFNNILKNAISYSDADSEIEISGKKEGSMVTVSFENSGTIPPDKLGSIFEKFYRMDEARQTATGGAGLGLAIAKDIITLHGGAISAESKNNRTVFTLNMPDS